jgi:biopolymer transport protein ExbB/TolQ
MDKIVNWLLLIIIFVFDPLAISLVIAANFAFSQLLPKKEYPLEEKIEDMKRVVDAYDSLEKEVNEYSTIEQALNEIEGINQSNDYKLMETRSNPDQQWKKNKISEEIQKIKEKLFSKKDDNTITYF